MKELMGKILSLFFLLIFSGCSFKSSIIKCSWDLPFPAYATRNYHYMFNKKGKIIIKREHIIMVNTNGRCY